MSTGCSPTNKMKAHKTDSRPQLENLDVLPIIDRSLIDYDKYHRFIGHAGRTYQMAIQASRGCPYKCFYCDVYKTYKNHRRRSVQHLFNEVRLLADMGIKRIEFIDDIFNVSKKGFSAFFELTIKHRLDIKFFFPTGLKGDILDKAMIDLMVEAGVIGANLSLEHASSRLQRVMRKNLDVEKFRDNLQYITKTYPFFVLGLNAMHGFPTETEDEALMTLDFIKSIRWAHFPYLSNVRVFPGTELEQFALEQGIPRAQIEQQQDMSFHDISPTLPFSQEFTRNVRIQFLREYVLSKERLRHVLPYQMEHFTEDELSQKYNKYFPTRIKSLDDLLEFVNINRSELGPETCLDENRVRIPDLRTRIKKNFPSAEKKGDALRLILVDLATYFSTSKDTREYSVLEPPLGLMALLSYVNREFGDRVEGKICKSRVDFDSYEELYNLINGFSPDIIGVSTLSFYRHFFHKAVDYIRKRGISTPIIAGGPYPTASYTEVLEDSNIDIVVIGEGEITLADILKEILANNKHLPEGNVLKNIPGIAFRRSRQFAELEEESNWME